MNPPYISVVLATKNEEKNIERLLKSILSQSLPRTYFEIILVDNNSTDNTRKIANKLIRNVYNLPEIADPKKLRNPRGFQLNFAVSKTKSSIIFFPDADMTFDRHLLEEAIELFNHQDIDALYVPEVIIGKGFLGKVRNFERSFYNETCIDAVRFVKKDVFLDVGGFDETNFRFGPDDWDFTIMVKSKTQKVTSTKNKIYHHEALLNLMQYFSKKWYYTGTFDEYIEKWGSSHPDIQKQFGFFYRYIGVFIEKGKWKRLLAHPLLAAGMFFLRFGVGLLYTIRMLFTHHVSPGSA